MLPTTADGYSVRFSSGFQAFITPQMRLPKNALHDVPTLHTIRRFQKSTGWRLRGLFFLNPFLQLPLPQAFLQPEISHVKIKKRGGGVSDQLMIAPLSWIMCGNGLTAPTLHCFSICLPSGLAAQRLKLHWECS